MSKPSLSVELAAGHFDDVRFQDGMLRVQGWMFLPDKQLDFITLYWNSTRIESAQCQIRGDVLQAYPWIRHADRSGFSFIFRTEAKAGCVDLVGYRRGRPIASLRTLVRSDLDVIIDVPPEELMKRVGGVLYLRICPRMHREIG